MVRLFVALEIPDELRERLVAIERGVEGARWVAAENLHISLRFIGEVGDAAARDIAMDLSAIRAPAFDVTLVGAGHFESNRRVRQLWIGVERNAALAALHDKVESVLVRAGLEPEGRRFQPHLTLARLNSAAPATVRRWLAANTLFRAVPFRVESYVLFSSFLGKNGPIYRAEAEFPLSLA
jgi:RNA 2',3'-cyclic 3'-phosphodiesterase